MYNSLRRRRGSNTAVDAHVRQLPAECHAGTPADYLRRHARESAEAARGT